MKYKRKKYITGVQQVQVPPKGNAGDVLGSAASLGATGAEIGSTFGPEGTVIGAAAGIIAGTATGIYKNQQAKRAHDWANYENTYFKNNVRSQDPNLEKFQAKKGLDMSKGKYKKGTIHIKAANKGKFTASANAAGESVQEHAAHVLADPNASPLQKKRANFARNASKWHKAKDGLDFGEHDPVHDDFPASRDWQYYYSGKGQKGVANSRKYNRSTNKPQVVNGNAKGSTRRDTYDLSDNYTPAEKEYYGDWLVSNTSKIYEDGTTSVMNAKPIEVEKDELVFSRRGKAYNLKADFKGGKTHAQGGEPYTAKEGDVIFPGKQRKKVMEAYKRGDYAALESMRMKLPKDTNKAVDGLDAKALEGLGSEGGAIEQNPFGTQSPINLNQEGSAGIDWAGGKGDPLQSGGGSGVSPTATGGGFNLGAIGGKVGNLATMAPTVYNTLKGAFGKPVQTTRRQYTPQNYTYTDLSNPTRRAALEQYNVDKNNVANGRFTRGQAIGYLSQAGVQNYKNQSDINNFEIGRHQDIINKNTGLQNEASLTNLGLNNEYDALNLQNKGKQTEYTARALEGASSLAQMNQLNNNLKANDQIRMGLARTQNYGYLPGIGTGYYAPDGSFVSGGNTYKNSGGKWVQYKKGTRYVRAYAN